MKANELMIGDYVWYSKANEYATKVIDIRFFGSEYAITCERAEQDPLRKKHPIDSFNVQILHPIPLTPEILEKNGWRLESESWKDLWINNNVITLEEGCDGHKYWWHMFDSPIVPLDYVHQLQHVLESCGISKKIEI